MSSESVLKAVRKGCNGCCRLVEWYQTETGSCYFTIEKEGRETSFRISDHKTWRRISSCIIMKNTKQTKIINFVKSEVVKMEKRATYRAFALIRNELSVG